MPSLQEVLTTLGNVLERTAAASRAIQQAQDTWDETTALLTAALDGANNPDATLLLDSCENTQRILAEQAALLGAILAEVAAYLERLRGQPGASLSAAADLTPKPISAPHPSNQPTFTLDAYDVSWATEQFRRLPRWERGKPAKALVFAPDGHSQWWTSGTHSELSAQIGVTLANSEHFRPPVVGSTALPAVAQHIEAQVAMRMRNNGVTFTVVMVNKKVCGHDDAGSAWGCRQAVTALLPIGYTMLVWEPGDVPVVLEGKARP